MAQPKKTPDSSIYLPGSNARPGRPQRHRSYPPYTDYGVACAPGTKPIWLYLRLSNYHNDAADAIERHRIDIARKIAAEGSYTVMGEFVDNDSASISAARTRRGWHLLLDRIEAREVTAVAFWKLDRCQRIASKGIEWLGRCSVLGCELISFSEGRVQASGAGKIIAGMQMLFAEAETDVMSTRQLAAQAHRAEAGYNHGGVVPFGFQLGDERIVDEHGRSGMRLRPHPVEFPALCDAVRLALAGESLPGIARYWREHYGITTADGRDQYAASILKVLRSPRLCGYRMRNVPWQERPKNLMQYVVRDEQGEPVLAHDAVCDRLTWERLQRNLDERHRTRKPWGSNPWLLNGLVFCPSCDRELRGTSRTAQRHYYECKTNRRLGAGTCDGGASLPAQALENYVIGWVAAYCTSERLDRAQRVRLSNAVDTALVGEYEQAQVAVAELKKLQGTPAYRGAKVTTLLEMISRAEDDVTRLRAALDAAAPATDLPELTGAQLVARWDAMSPEERRRAIHRAVSRIDVVELGRRPVEERVAVTPRF